ncbi:hypothetical protein N3K66_008720 [Trichothecium roseum]|uniref:Uncharacterized protein n=1 Tax=Trichothecium roseum TaxID=47278 RepID=A0ACC0UR17_9HYPO|nr:hypothetical protein N3K66_008720 [Trichothecium roseum]
MYCKHPCCQLQPVLSICRDLASASAGIVCKEAQSQRPPGPPSRPRRPVPLSPSTHLRPNLLIFCILRPTVTNYDDQDNNDDNDAYDLFLLLTLNPLM